MEQLAPTNAVVKTSGVPMVANPVTAKDLPGIYVASIDIPGPYFKAEVRVADNNTYKVRVAQIEGGPSPAFAGRWTFEKGILRGEHYVPGMGKVVIEADLNGVSLAQLESEPQAVTISIAGDPIPFKMVKTDKPFF
jgi:hypothetical protein